MAVLTALVLTEGTATIGHVGDTRLYKRRHGRIEKVTRDHSPIGEREDAKALSEFEAMRHPRRNEVYRDVGSEPHSPGDAEFVDVQEIPFEPDAALLLCSGSERPLDSTSSPDGKANSPAVRKSFCVPSTALGRRKDTDRV